MSRPTTTARTVVGYRYPGIKPDDQQDPQVVLDSFDGAFSGRFLCFARVFPAVHSNHDPCRAMCPVASHCMSMPIVRHALAMPSVHTYMQSTVCMYTHGVPAGMENVESPTSLDAAMKPMGRASTRTSGCAGPHSAEPDVDITARERERELVPLHAQSVPWPSRGC